MARILVAEDNPADVYLLREALKLEGGDVEMTVVTDGEQAMAYIRQQGAHENAVIPDLVVLDLNLPKSDGSDVLRCLRQTPAYSQIPVVVLTSSDSLRDRKTIESLGANSFITKPSDLDAFMSLGQILIGFIGQAPVTGLIRPPQSLPAT